MPPTLSEAAPSPREADGADAHADDTGDETAPASSRFVDSEEVFHFFNDEMVLSTNDVRGGDAEDDLADRSVSAWTTTHDSFPRDASESDDEDDEINARPLQQITYEDVFPTFDDLYLWDIVSPGRRAERQRRRKQQRRAARVLRAYCRDVCKGDTYLHRKRAEFLRVCHGRALDADRDREQEERVVQATVNNTPGSDPATPPRFFEWRRREGIVDLVSAELQPRKWPHLPYRNPREWMEDVRYVVEFTRRVLELPEGSLLYEPIDVDAFVQEACHFLQHHGVDARASEATDSSSTDENDKQLTQPALAGIVAVFAVATRLQSFSLVAMVATLLLRHKRFEPAESQDSSCTTVRELLMVCCKSLSSFGTDVVLPATYPRALVSQWKICAYQPCASDAIATDGLYLYVFGRSGLLKIGTGYGHTVRDYVYAHNKTYVRSRDAERSWLCCIDNNLYCRTLLMQENRVDRISTVDLMQVDELFFAPTESTGGNHASGNSVYAMVSDGKSLFTVKCIDTQAKTDRRKLRPSTRGRRSLSKDLTKSSTKSRLRADPVGDDGESIRVGDRVIRGPHWKWGNQDGENGCPGTVERISTWGGVKGCGITVRWDKNHRVNTYRWGAEGCYDLIVVTERDGKIISKKPTPKNSGDNQADEDTTPRHQFVVYRYDVTRLTSILEMDDVAINSFLEISPSGRRGEAIVTEDSDAYLSALHIHMLAISDSPTSWMCDGGTTGCLGDNAGTRYRCEAGCDYDLCEVCMHTTMTDRRGVNILAELLLAEGVISEVSHADQPSSSNTDDTKAAKTQALNPDGVPPSSQEREAALVDELMTFWCGLYSRRECVVALRRTNYNLIDAAEWLEAHRSEMENRRILSAQSKIILAPKCPTILDPVVLVAGSLFATGDLLCVICPPGLYQSESVKRSSHPTDVAWFFSLSDGSMCGNSEPVFLKGAPAGSPICVDECRSRILVHSSYLGCMEEYTVPFPDIRSGQCQMKGAVLSTSSPGDVAEYVFTHLRRLVDLRVCLPAYRTIRAGLRDILQVLERECGGLSCGSSATSSHKSSARQLRNVRGRLTELDRLKVEDRPGYVVPYSIDFREDGLLHTLHAMRVVMASLHEKQRSPRLHSQLADVMFIFAGIVREYFIVDVHFNPPDSVISSLETSARTIERLALGQCFEWASDEDPDLNRLKTATVYASQDILVRGSQAGLFRSVDCQATLGRVLRQMIKINSRLPPCYFQIMITGSDKLASEYDCAVAFVRRLLVQGETFADDGLSGYVFFDDGLNDIVELLFQLATQEFVSECEQNLELVKWTVVGKALLSVFNACSMSVQAEQAAEKPNATKLSSSTNARERFNFFIQECFKACEAIMIEHWNGVLPSQSLENSVCGTILRLVIAEITNYPHFLDEASRLHLTAFATAVGKFRSDERSYRSEFMQEFHVIESSHPYSRNQSSLRKVVHIEGAKCLHIEFDGRCSTTGESDFVFVTPGYAWFNSERSPFGENGIGDNGGCFFGSPAKGNWPTNGISISGDTATIMLCTTSQARESSADECQRWGLKCTIRGISLESERWMDDLKQALATACRSVARMDSDSKSRIRSFSLSDNLAALQRIVWPAWLEFSTSDSTCDEHHDLKKMIELSLPKKPSTRMLGDIWTDVWRKLVLVSVITATPCAESAQKGEKTPGEKLNSIIKTVLPDVMRIEQWVIRRVQLIKEWWYLREENVSFEDFTERYADDSRRLSELCQLNDVVYAANDGDGPLQQLYHKLYENAPQDTCQAESLVIMEIDSKVEFVLQRIRDNRQDLGRDFGSNEYLFGYHDQFSPFRFFTSPCSASQLHQYMQDQNSSRSAFLSAADFISGSSEKISAGSGGNLLVGCIGEIVKTEWLENDATSTQQRQDACQRLEQASKRSLGALADVSERSCVRLAALAELTLLSQLGFLCGDAVVRCTSVITSCLLHDWSDSMVSSRSAHEITWICFRSMVESVLTTDIYAGEPRTQLLDLITTRFIPLVAAVDSKWPAQKRSSYSRTLGRLLLTLVATLPTIPRLIRNDWMEVCFSVLISNTSLPWIRIAAIRYARRKLKHDGICAFWDADAIRKTICSIGETLSIQRDSSSDVHNDESGTFCAVVYNTEGVHSKILRAVEQVGEPDVLSDSISTDELLALQKVVQKPTDVDAKMVHRSVRCDGCNQSPLKGYRFKCFVCPNYDLCTACYSNQTHSVDHQFVRISEPSESGELLQPRANGVDTIPETSLVGSKQWKGTVLRTYLSTFGFGLFRRGSLKTCVETAKSLSGHGISVGVMRWEEFVTLDKMFDWERLVFASLEPGTARLTRRSSSSNSLTKADQSSMSTFNSRIASMLETRHNDELDNGLDRVHDIDTLGSELVSLVHLVCGQHFSGQNRDPKLSDMVEALLEQTQLLVDSASQLDGDIVAFQESFGLANVLGGYVEQLRTGGIISWRDPTTSSFRYGAIKYYTVGCGHVVVVPKAENDAKEQGSEELITLREAQVISVPLLDNETVPWNESLVTTFCSVIRGARDWLNAKDDGSDKWVFATDLLATWLQAIKHNEWRLLPSLLDNEVTSVFGSIPSLIFQMANTYRRSDSVQGLQKIRHLARALVTLHAQKLEFSMGTRPMHKSEYQTDDSTVYRPNPKEPSETTDFVYNMFAYSSRNELPQHSGRNKLLEYWEKNVIPAIESYVSGSFKSYEMDYFFAQLREPLREGNSAAAMKIAFTLCDGHVPSGCQYPDPDTDWSALQIDDIEVGCLYIVSEPASGPSTWPNAMLWTLGQAGVARLVSPSGMVLLEFWNSMTSTRELWWFHVDSLRSAERVTLVSDVSVDSFRSARQTLLTTHRKLIGAIARELVFSFLKFNPDLFSLSSPHENEGRFRLVDMLRIAAAAELGCQERLLLGERVLSPATKTIETAEPRLTAIIQRVLSRMFETTIYHSEEKTEEQAAVIVPLVPRHEKYAKSGSSGTKKGGSSKAPDLDPKILSAKHRYSLVETLLHEMKRCLDASASFLKHNAFMVTSDSPPKGMARLHIPKASCFVVSFAVHPVLMDLPAGSSLEFFKDERCTDRIFGFYGEKRGLNYLPSLVIPGDQCFLRIQQGTYARYKFRVDPLTPDFGLAFWIGEELHQKLVSTSFSAFELESILSSVLNALVEYLIGTPLPPSAKSVVYQLVSKLINFAISRSVLNAVPVTKLVGFSQELTQVYETEQSTQKGLFSRYFQHLCELMSLVEEVARLKGSSTQVLATAWWSDFVRLALFTRVLATKRDGATTDVFKRVFCGRAPVREIEATWKISHDEDVYCRRMVLVQKLPITQRVPELTLSLSRFIRRVALEECGEADDQSVLSAADVTRFGILARVVFLPVDGDGKTTGYAVVDLGREDIMHNVLTRISREDFVFGDEECRGDEDAKLIEDVCTAATEQHVSTSTESGSVGSTEDRVWACPTCTLENPATEAECGACGSPMPSELAGMLAQATNSSVLSPGNESPQTDEDPSSEGWACDACTLFNSWDDDECGACGSERNPDLEPPVSERDGSGSSDNTKTTTLRCLSALRLSDVFGVAEKRAVSQVDAFLEAKLLCRERLSLSQPFEKLLSRELENEKVSLGSQGRLRLLGHLLHPINPLSSEPSKVIAALVSVIKTTPYAVYKWLRSSGFGLDLELGHYTSLEDAMNAQSKWTQPMDCQLISFARRVSSRIGILSLVELCPSHLACDQATEFALLAGLDTRDLRLRYSLLARLNLVLVDTLPIASLQPSTDPNSIRARLLSIRQLIFPGVKIRFFAQTQDNANLACSNMNDAANKRPIVTLDRRMIVSNRRQSSSYSLSDCESSLFASTMKQLSKVPRSHLRAKRPTGASDPFVSFIAIFKGENVVGEGGPYRQLFNDIAQELIAPGSPLFIPTQNNAHKIGDFRERYLPKPSSASRELLRMFEFVGVLMGCCLRTGVRLNIRLAPIVWKMMVKQSLSLVDLEHIDWSLCESFKYIESLGSDASMSSDEVLFDTFTTTLSDGTCVELKQGGTSQAVTKTNCKEYVRLAKAAQLQQCKMQVDAILRGIGSIVPSTLLQLCTWSELQQWVCGSLDIDVDLLKRHTRYAAGMTPDKFPHLDMFWDVLRSFDEDNKRRFINFAWGQDTLPVDDAEFDRTHTRLLIKTPPVSSVEQDLLLPKADTCFFNIELPAYSSRAIMHEKLMLAITLCTSMDGDDQAGRLELYYAGDELEEDHME